MIFYAQLEKTTKSTFNHYIVYCSIDFYKTMIEVVYFDVILLSRGL